MESMEARKGDIGNTTSTAGRSYMHPARSKSLHANVNLLEGDSPNEDGVSDGEALDFKINADYARKFEHNKKREELHRLEDKYQKAPESNRRDYGDKYDEDSSSSDDESEDDNGVLATEDLDEEISATLRAIRSKDPRVYDQNFMFYAPIEEERNEEAGSSKEKPIYLQDYHRQNLLAGHTGDEEAQTAMEATMPRSFAQEQDDLRKSFVTEMNAELGAAQDDDEDEFIVPKSIPNLPRKTPQSRKSELDPQTASKDPETYLSNFMAARAWVDSEGTSFQPFDSDSDEELERAEEFEAAYNLRFEDPKNSNEVLKSYSRDVAAAKSVRREDLKGRKKARDSKREQKMARTKEVEDEKARLRKLKIEEMEERLRKIKDAAGIREANVLDEQWTKFLEAGWDDASWEAEMSRRFGEAYYAEEEEDRLKDGGGEDGTTAKRRKLKKPKWGHDIEINDIIPGFQEEETDNLKERFVLSESEEDAGPCESSAEQPAVSNVGKSSKDHKKEKAAKKRMLHLERKQIEQIVDNRLNVDDAPIPGKPAGGAQFRYRETSPISFGLTARDILMADDARLNEFAGLKKIASFRDAEKKRRDKKRLGKKARLREWRKQTFGNEDGPEITVKTEKLVVMSEEKMIVADGKKKRKRKSKK